MLCAALLDLVRSERFRWPVDGRPCAVHVDTCDTGSTSSTSRTCTCCTCSTCGMCTTCGMSHTVCALCLVHVVPAVHASDGGAHAVHCSRPVSAPRDRLQLQRQSILLMHALLGTLAAFCDRFVSRWSSLNVFSTWTHSSPDAALQSIP